MGDKPPPLAKKHEKYRGWLEEHNQLLTELTQDLHHELRPELPKELVHYTSSTMEIIETNCLRATNLKYTNDYTEIRHGHDLAQRLRQELEASASSDIEKTFLGEPVQRALSFLAKRVEVYGFNLSEAKDDLTQWRSYAGNGTGHMVGFYPDRFESGMQAAGESADISIMLLKVLYDEELQEESLRKILQKITRSVEKDQSSCDFESNLEWQETLLAGRAVPYMVSFKRMQFQSEKEWRLVRIDYRQPGERSEAVKFRKSGPQIIPFVEFRPITNEDGGKTLLPIQSIELGPQTDATLGPHATELLLKEHGYDEVPVTKCDIPFRSFTPSS